MQSTRMDPKAWGVFSTKRENQFLPQPGETRLKGILNDSSLNQTDPKPAQPVQQILASSRLKIDFQSIVEPAALAGRLKPFLPNWQKTTVDPVILDVVRGYKLEFLSPPIQEYIRNPLLFLHAESEKIDSEVATLLEKGALNMVKPVSGQFLSSLFLVPKRDGNSRPVINLKELNVFLKYDHFKMEGIHLRDLLQPQDWLGKIDLKDAYFVIPVWKDHRKYIRFVWKGSFLEFACLPFGLAAAPRLFTKVLLRSNTEYGVSRFRCEHSGYDSAPSQLQSGINKISLQLPASSPRSLCKGSLPVNWEVDCFYTSNLSCSSTLPSPPASQTPSFSTTKELRCNNTSVQAFKQCDTTFQLHEVYASVILQYVLMPFTKIVLY